MSEIKKKYWSYKDLQILVLTEGVAALDNIKGEYSRATLRRAMKKLKESNHPKVAELEAYFLANLGSLGRGRGAPVVGEARSYKVQKIKDQGPFLRVPLCSLGVKKGDTVKAMFNKGTILIETV